MFAPINVAGPDQRRKQLAAKLGQQQQANASSNAGLAASVGQAFHPAVVHALAKTVATQSTNVLPSVLARLGITGNPNANEVSQGFGAPIAGYRPSAASIAPPGPVSPGIPVASAVAPGPAPLTGADTSFAGVPVNNTPIQNQQGAFVAPNQSMNPSADSGPSQPSLVDLGGGHFFDPSSGQIVFNPAAAPGVSGALGAFKAS